MGVIVPTLLSENPDDYRMQVERLHPFAERVHVDFSDGEFAPTITVNESQIWWPQEWNVDIHAMLAHPADHMPALLALKPHMIIFHAEAKDDIVPLMQQAKQVGIKAGISLMRGTVPSTVAQAIEAADHVMIFSGELGKYGGVASLMQLEKVRLIRNIKADIEVGWDGGITVENAFSLAQGGVDVFNVGSTINKSDDPAAAYKALVNEINKHGVI